MSIQQLYTLLKKYRRQQCTAEEWEELNRWYEQFSEEAEQIPAMPDEKLDLLFARIEKEIGYPKTGKQLNGRNFRWYAGIAAVLLIGLMAGRYFIDREVSSRKGGETFSILPGCTQAELILEDGSTIKLDSTTVVEREGGKLIKTRTSTVLDYSGMKEETGQMVYNTISVPLGGEYCLILADGTQVWLNAGSILKYPVAFSGKKREVELEGEAYFEVTKSSKPFVVNTSELEVRVLGTSFNVSAYKSDACVRATLVSGCVEVWENQHKYRITPGHTLTYARSTEQVTVEECDTDLYTSWIRGKFKFRDMRLEDIMVKLNRWYNCRVEFEDAFLKDLRFSGAAEKDRSVEYLLEMIRAVTDVTFEIENKIIRVKHK